MRSNGHAFKAGKQEFLARLPDLKLAQLPRSLAALPSISESITRLKRARLRLSFGATRRAFTFYLGNPIPRLKLARLRLSLGATHRAFTFHLGYPIPRLKLARLPLSLGATHRAFTFYLGNPIPRFLLS